MRKKVLNVCYSDYANFMFDHTEALRSVGIDAEAIKLKRHEFEYAGQAKVVSREEMAKKIKEADVIQVFHSCLISLSSALENKKEEARIIGWHTGSPYRMNPESMNEKFNNVCELIFTDQCEFEFLGAKNLRYMAAAIDVRNYPVRKGTHTPRVFAHYPSNPEVKGTQDIRRMIEPAENVFRDRMKFYFSIDKLSHAEQIKRMGLCDIYIELFKPTLKGKQYGCYGVTAFEAAALGKIVLTNNIYPNVYRKAYGIELPFVIANNEREFREQIDNLNCLSIEEVLELQEQTRTWLSEYHSYEASGKYWAKIVSL